MNLSRPDAVAGRVILTGAAILSSERVFGPTSGPRTLPPLRVEVAGEAADLARVRGSSTPRRRPPGAVESGELHPRARGPACTGGRRAVPVDAALGCVHRPGETAPGAGEGPEPTRPRDGPVEPRLDAETVRWGPPTVPSRRAGGRRAADAPLGPLGPCGPAGPLLGPSRPAAGSTRVDHRADGRAGLSAGTARASVRCRAIPRAISARGAGRPRRPGGRQGARGQEDVDGAEVLVSCRQVRQGAAGSSRVSRPAPSRAGRTWPPAGAWRLRGSGRRIRPVGRSASAGGTARARPPRRGVGQDSRCSESAGRHRAGVPRAVGPRPPARSRRVTASGCTDSRAAGHGSSSVMRVSGSRRPGRPQAQDRAGEPPGARASMSAPSTAAAAPPPGEDRLGLRVEPTRVPRPSREVGRGGRGGGRGGRRGRPRGPLAGVLPPGVEGGDAGGPGALLLGAPRRPVAIGPHPPRVGEQLVLAHLEGAEGGADQAEGLEMPQAPGRVAAREPRAVREVGHGDAAEGAMAPRPAPGVPVHPPQDGVRQGLQRVPEARVHDPREDVQRLDINGGDGGGQGPSRGVLHVEPVEQEHRR